MKSCFSAEEIKDLYVKIKEINNISLKKPNQKYLSDASFDSAMLDAINSLSIISLSLIDNELNLSNKEYSKELIIKKLYDTYNFIKLYETEYMF